MVFKALIDKISQLRENQGFLKYFKNTSWLIVEKLLRIVYAIILGSLVARYLGPKDFGSLNYVQSIVMIFLPLSTLGLDNIVIKNLVEDQIKFNTVLGTSFLIKLFGSILLLIVLGTTLQFMDNEALVDYYIILIALTTIFHSFNVIDYYFQSKVLSKYVVFTNIGMMLVSGIVKLLLIYNKSPLLYFIYVIILDAFLLAVGLILFYYRSNKLDIKTWNFNSSIAKKMLNESWPLILSGIFVTLYMRIDQIMIKEILGNEAVGKYAAAIKISEVWYFFPVVLASSLFPAIINSKKISKKIYYERLQKLFSLIFKIAFLIAVFITFLGDFIIDLLYGIEYYEASSVLKIHIWTGIFVFIGVVSGKWYVIENLQIISFLRTFAGCVINIVANLYFIKEFGIKGAAISTLLSQIIACYVFDVFDKRTRKIFFMKTKALLFMG